MKALTTCILLGLSGLASGLSCYEGWIEGSGEVGLHNFTTRTCTEHQVWCFSLYAADKNSVQGKMCWNPDWENAKFKEDGCINGQHCLDGTCYENATVCLCNDKDLCNDWTVGGNASTPMPAVPTPPPGGWHECYYGIQENSTADLDSVELCTGGEGLCIRVTNQRENYEYRSCWDSSFNMEFSRPGCYEGFTHCHRDSCHNDTLLCVCADNKCNSAEYSSEAPPITPGSGLYCYSGGWSETSYSVAECRAEEHYCIEFLASQENQTMRDCWNPDYYNKYNYTGCQVTQTCFRGACYNTTVCLCQDPLCNDYGLEANATTAIPSEMTTTNTTMHCWYGRGPSDQQNWQEQICGPQEDRCLIVIGDETEAFRLGQCYSSRYNDGRYLEGCYRDGQHCWDNTCHNGTVCICLEPMCNLPGYTTTEPHHTTPGSGLECYYGWLEGNNIINNNNLTTQICNRNESLCLAAYGAGEQPGEEFFMGSCWDPSREEGRYNDTDGCSTGLHCWHMEDGTQHCHNGTVCTCSTHLCNSVNASSTLPTEATPTTGVETMRCWFGEQHPGTDTPEQWQVEVCESTEHFCYQMVAHQPMDNGDLRFESRQCWDLKYEDEKYSGAGCYRGPLCHHDYCFNDTTVCICKEPECNGWSEGGNVTTDIPVTGGSGLLCYTDTAAHPEVRECTSAETLCMYFEDGGDQHLGCYNPDTNQGEHKKPGCWSDVKVEQFGDASGRLCLCDNDLCNKDFLHGKACSVGPLAGLLVALISLHNLLL